MLSAAEGFFLFVATTESALGVFGNGFIACVNCIDFVKNKKFSKIDLILTGLALSRICVIWIINIDGYIKIFCPQILTSSNIIEYIGYLWVTMNHLSIWFATSLNIFYFLKIANFSHCIFLWLKRRIDRVFVFLAGCLFVSWLVSLLQVVYMINDSKMQDGNTSWQVHLQKRKFAIYHILLYLGAIVFFIITLIACILLTVSLWRHNRQMQLNVTGFRDLNTEAHVKAVRVLISFIILFTLYFVGTTIQIICFFSPQNILMLILGLTVVSMYPCCHSFILILANSKLKQASLRVLQKSKCCEKGGKNLRAASQACREMDYVE